MNWKVLLVGVLIVAPLVVLLRVGFNFDPEIVESPLIGQDAPRFTLADRNGKTFNLEEMIGKPVVINFWATYCPPCYTEHPLFLESSRRWAGDVHFLGVIYHDDPSLVARWEQQLGAWGPSLVDEDGRMAIAYGVYGPPETFFIGRDGKVKYKVIGAVSPEQMETYITELLTGEAT